MPRLSGILPTPKSPNVLLEAHGHFWRAFIQDLNRYNPLVPPLDHPEETHLDIPFNATHYQPRPDRLYMTVQQWEALKQSHTSFVEAIHAKNYSLPYLPTTRGIVTTAGGPYLPVALFSIRMLRETGSTLPVEVFLGNRDEWDDVVCGTILPSLNARCLVLQDIFDSKRSTRKAGLEKYQYKIMSILFSSFEEVLFLDSDCFPVYDPGFLFQTEPFSKTGLTLWPDFWYSSESFLFFEIAGIKQPPLARRAATEAGEMLYSKRSHELPLLLAAYYNYYGPDYYYPLQSQGAPGEGDKETFPWSADALDTTSYIVRTPVQALGYKTKEGAWRGSAMAQFDPSQDMDSTLCRDGGSATCPRPLFIHANFPKIDPGSIFDDSSFGADGPTKDSDGTRRRIWFSNKEETEQFFGFDLEQKVWEVVLDLACRYEGKIQAWRSKTKVCSKAREYVAEIFPSIQISR